MVQYAVDVLKLNTLLSVVTTVAAAYKPQLKPGTGAYQQLAAAYPRYLVQHSSLLGEMPQERRLDTLCE